MKKSFIIAAMALVVGSLSLPAKAAEDVLIVNLQYVVSQSNQVFLLENKVKLLIKRWLIFVIVFQKTSKQRVKS